MSAKKTLVSLAVAALLIALASSAAAQVGTYEEAKAIVEAELFDYLYAQGNASFGDRALRTAGVVITTWAPENDVTITSDCWFFFVDELPGANWEHAAQYIFVDAADGVVTTVPVSMPPNDLVRMEALNDPAADELQEIEDNILRHLGAEPCTPNPSFVTYDDYAVIVSGGVNAGSNKARYLNDISFIYKTLVNTYGYSDAQIYVLYADGPAVDLDGDGDGNDVDYSATKANLTTAMTAAKNNIDSNGKFFFFSTNHGGDDGGSSDPWDVVLWLWGESIRDDEFGTLCSGWTCQQMIFVMEQCYSGGMIDDIVNAQTDPCSYPRVCVMTACDKQESSWGWSGSNAYDEYVYHWISAVNGQTPAYTSGGSPQTPQSVDADTNDDGYVSSTEAHTYAVANDVFAPPGYGSPPTIENPQISDCEYFACDCTAIDINKPGPSCGKHMATDGSDYVGTSAADYAVWRPSNGRWYVNGGSTVKHGSPGDLPVPGDYDGNSTLDRAVWRPSNGKWYVYGGSTTKHGQDGDIPVPGNYTGNAATEICVWRPSNGRWYVYGGSATKYGRDGDIPVPADYNGDGYDEFAVWRPSNGKWYVYGGSTTKHGQSGDIPIPFNASGGSGSAVELVVYRPSNGRWYVYGGSTYKHGQLTDVPVPGDYDGNGSMDIAVWRPTNGRWYMYSPASNTKYGSTGDIPLVRGKY